ncbi:hypothetical protein TNCV_287881 [Trichonephila clavipes]|nr:hypothetical protein TNCV_287881 [Trichonephila clavipes]
MSFGVKECFLFTIGLDAWWWAEHTAAVRKEIFSSSTLGFRMPEKSDNRTDFFKLLRVRPTGGNCSSVVIMNRRSEGKVKKNRIMVGGKLRNGINGEGEKVIYDGYVKSI